MNKNSSDSHLPRVRNYSREDLQEYIQKRMGPQHLPTIIVLPITLIYAAIFITGVLGNLIICRVIAKNQSMQTTTNYYLFSLAMSDLSLLILGLPYDVSLYWQQYPWPLGTSLCKFRALVSEMASYTSVLTIVAFSMERYLAICHPLLSHSMSGLERATKIIFVLWAVALIGAIPFAIYTKINYLEYPENSGNYLYETAFCAMLDNNVPSHFPIYEMSFGFFFITPMAIIIVLYVLMGRKIQSRGNELSANLDGSVHRDARHLRSRRNIIRMLTAVVITFFICWFPFHAQRLFYIYGQKFECYAVVNEWAFYITGVLYYLSATINPILYNLMSVKYRTAFRKSLACGFNLFRRNGNRRTRRDRTNLRTSKNLRTSMTMSRKGNSTELFPANCESNDFEKKSYSPLPVADLEVKSKSLSFSTDGRDYHQHIMQTGTAFDRCEATSI